MTEKIGYNPYFYSYPQYLSSNLGVNNKFSPNFRSNSVGVATPQPTVNYTTPPDTVEISAGNKINEASTQEKQKTGMSTGAKWALGILGTAATVYGCVVGHRMINKPSIEKVAKNFSEIFRREIGTDEAQKMVKNYENIININNEEEFINKALEQVKKDYGFENLDINITRLKTKNKFNEAVAEWALKTGELKIKAPNLKDKFCKKEFIRNLIHELHHAKQEEIAYRTSPKKLFEAIAISNRNQNLKDILNNPKELKARANEFGYSIEALKEAISQTLKEEKLPENFKLENYDAINKLFGKATPLEKGSKDYEIGMKYIENIKNYVDCKENRAKYFSQLLEKEAHQTGKNFDQIYNYFASPWRIF